MFSETQIELFRSARIRERDGLLATDSAGRSPAGPAGAVALDQRRVGRLSRAERRQGRGRPPPRPMPPLFLPHPFQHRPGRDTHPTPLPPGCWSLALLIVLALGPGPGLALSADTDARTCQRCHAMETLAERDPHTGAIRDLHVPPQAYQASAHGAMDCTDCHRRGYRRYPHPGSAVPEDLSCVGCHVESTPSRAEQFRTIDGEFQASVHGAIPSAPGEQGGEPTTPMDCHSCHDPHRFRLAQVGDDLGSKIGGHNRVCLSCHGELRDDLEASHGWLPHREVHWRSVRCIECHTPAEGHQSHRVLAGEASNRECVACHSQNPRLLGQLYAHRSAQAAEASGWMDRTLRNPAYVVGMSRHPTLDQVALAALGLTLVAIAAHALGRWWLRLRRGRGGRP